MDDRQWQAALNVYGSTRSRKHKIELEAMLRKGWQARQAELERAKMQAFDFESGLGCVQAELEQARAESEGRRRALEEVGEERRREWERAENAEAELEQARARVNMLREFIEQDNPPCICDKCEMPPAECRHCRFAKQDGQREARRTAVLAATRAQEG